MKGRSFRLALAAGFLLLSGCALTSEPLEEISPEPAPEPAANQALPGRITDIVANETGQGVVVKIASSSQLAYGVFEKSDPPGLIFNFPKVALDPAVPSRVGPVGSVIGIVPKRTADGSTRVEIALQKGLAHQVIEHAGGIEILLTPAAGKGSVGAVPVALKDVRVNQNAQGTSVQLVGLGAFPTPRSYRLENPPRLVVDMMGVSAALPSRDMAVQSAEVSKVQWVATDERVRLVIDLADPMVEHRVDKTGDTPVIHLSRNRGAGGAASGAEPEGVSGAHLPTLKNIEIRQERDAVTVALQLDRPGVRPLPKRVGSTLTLDWRQLKVPFDMARRTDVSSLGGPVTTVDIYSREKGGGRMVLTLANDTVDHEVAMKGSEVLIRVGTIASSNRDGEDTLARASKGKEYHGEKITLDVREMDIQNALKLVTEPSGKNLITLDGVRGTVTMRISEPWDQVLDTILDMKGLSKREEGNTILIGLVNEFQRLDDDHAKMKKSRQDVETLITEAVPISFADGGEVKKWLESGSGEDRLLSSRGSCAFDARTRLLIVIDVPGRFSKIRELIAQLDKPIPQVLIEARIVEVTRGKDFNLGISWGANYKPKWRYPFQPGNDANWALSGSSERARGIHALEGVTYTGILPATPGTTSPLRPVAEGADPPTVTIPQSLQPPFTSLTGAVARNVDLMGSVVSNIGMHVGTVWPRVDLDIELGASELIGSVRLISSPRVMTLDNQAASIQQGTQIPYTTRTAEGNDTKFIAATLGLTVTPKVAPNGYIALDVDAHNDAPGRVPPGADVPGIDTRSVKTKVLIKSGETVVLGGIYTDRRQDDQNGIPGLNRLPILGNLFKNATEMDAQSEMLIFITPRLVVPPQS